VKGIDVVGAARDHAQERLFSDRDFAFMPGIQRNLEIVGEFVRYGVVREDQNGHINEGRPHDSLDDMTPLEYRRTYESQKAEVSTN